MFHNQRNARTDVRTEIHKIGCFGYTTDFFTLQPKKEKTPTTEKVKLKKIKLVVEMYLTLYFSLCNRKQPILLGFPRCTTFYNRKAVFGWTI